mgnify:CR=1 FL=1
MIKIARFKNYAISQEYDGSIEVDKFYENTIGALREVAAIIGMNYDDKWNTRTFGKKLLETIQGRTIKTNEEASSTIGEYVIVKEDNGSITIYKEYDNTKEGLREIADEIGFKYDPTWNTRQFGANLIKHLGVSECYED